MDPSRVENASATQNQFTPEHSDLQAIITQLKLMILDDLKVPINAANLDDEMTLLEGGVGLDSITLFELITLIEKRYEITFPIENLNSEVFASLKAAAQQIQLLRNPEEKGVRS